VEEEARRKRNRKFSVARGERKWRDGGGMG